MNDCFMVIFLKRERQRERVLDDDYDVPTARVPFLSKII